MLISETLGVLLAGGAGERLYPLTRDRAKPAVPFGGIYRIIDVTLSNCINSGLRKIFVVTQYKALSLNRHIRHGWINMFAYGLDEFIETIPPEKRVGEDWYLRTADAVRQNLYSINSVDGIHYVLILSGDHICKINYESALDFRSHQDWLSEPYRPNRKVQSTTQSREIAGNVCRISRRNTFKKG
jgi:glucose-1-phosphate adenylyltransferase